MNCLKIILAALVLLSCSKQDEYAYLNNFTGEFTGKWTHVHYGLTTEIDSGAAIINVSRSNENYLRFTMYRTGTTTMSYAAIIPESGIRELQGSELIKIKISANSFYFYKFKKSGEFGPSDVDVVTGKR